MTFNARASNYKVQYFTYYDHRTRKRKSIYIPKEGLKEFKAKYNSNTACFAGFRNELGSYSKVYNDPYNKADRTRMPMPNRVYYLLDPNPGGYPKPTLTEKYAWLRLCKEYKLLPEYVVPSTVRKGCVVFDISETSPSLLYTYLSMMRAIVEYPAFVKATVYLVNKLGMNFYAAFVYASILYVTNSGHHIINPYRAYYNVPRDKILSQNDMEIHWMRNLRLYVDNPSKYDKRDIYKVGNGGWNCYNTIDRISNFRAKICVRDLFKEELASVIYSDTDEEARQHYEGLVKAEKVKLVLEKPIAKTPKKKEVKKK